MDFNPCEKITLQQPSILSGPVNIIAMVTEKSTGPPILPATNMATNQTLSQPTRNSKHGPCQLLRVRILQLLQMAERVCQVAPSSMESATRGIHVGIAECGDGKSRETQTQIKSWVFIFQISRLCQLSSALMFALGLGPVWRPRRWRR